MNLSDKPNPKTVDAVVEDIIAELPLEARVGTANLDEDEFHVVKLTLGRFVRHILEQLDAKAKRELIESCRKKSGDSFSEIDPRDPCFKTALEKIGSDS